MLSSLFNQVVRRYTHAMECTTAIPLLTADFVASDHCERQVTWAKDRGMQIVHVMWDADGYAGLRVI